MFTLGTLFNTFIAPRLGKIIAVIIVLAILFYLLYRPYQRLKQALKQQQDSTLIYKQQVAVLESKNKELVLERDTWHSKYYKETILREEKISRAKEKAINQPLKKQLMAFSDITKQPAPMELKIPVYAYQVNTTFYQASNRGPMLVTDSTTFAETLSLLAENKQRMIEDSTMLKICALIKEDAKTYVNDVENEVRKAKLINIPSLKRRLTKVFEHHQALRDNILK